MDNGRRKEESFGLYPPEKLDLAVTDGVGALNAG